MFKPQVVLVLSLTVFTTLAVAQAPKTLPHACTLGPCIFYNGDFNVNDTKNAQGFANENTLFIASVFTYGAVGVVSSSGVTILGIFTNNQAVGYDGIDPATANWEIRRNMDSTGGTLIASGSAAAQWTYTGRSGFGNKEYELLVPVTPRVHLGGGKYWFAAQPQCTNNGNPNCSTAQYFLSNTTAPYSNFIVNLNLVHPIPFQVWTGSNGQFSYDCQPGERPACDFVSFGLIGK